MGDESKPVMGGIAFGPRHEGPLSVEAGQPFEVAVRDAHVDALEAEIARLRSALAAAQRERDDWERMCSENAERANRAEQQTSDVLESGQRTLAAVIRERDAARADAEAVRAALGDAVSRLTTLEKNLRASSASRTWLADATYALLHDLRALAPADPAPSAATPEPGCDLCGAPVYIATAPARPDDHSPVTRRCWEHRAAPAPEAGTLRERLDAPGMRDRIDAAKERLATEAGTREEET